MSKEQVVEETYAEQIAKKSKIKRIIISVVSLSLVLMIAVAFIVMACVKVDSKPSFITEPTRIYFNNETTVQYDNEDQLYQDFMDEYNKTFTTSYLSALFSGNLGGYDIEERVTQTLPEDVTEQTYVTFLYKNQKITLLDKDGKTYYSKYNSNYSIDFYEVSFVLSNEDKQQNIDMYLKYTWQDSNKEWYTKVTFKANTYNLYQIYANK